MYYLLQPVSFKENILPARFYLGTAVHRWELPSASSSLYNVLAQGEPGRQGRPGRDDGTFQWVDQAGEASSLVRRCYGTSRSRREYAVLITRRTAILSRKPFVNSFVNCEW